MANVSTHNKTHDKASGLLEDYEKLAMLTNAVVIQSYNLKDDSSYQEVYKCYRHWKIVLSKLNEGHNSYCKVSQILNFSLLFAILINVLISVRRILKNKTVCQVAGFRYSHHFFCLYSVFTL